MKTTLEKLMNFNIILLLMFIPLTLHAQNYGKGLLFSEVYLNKENPQSNWLEVYNPTDQKLGIRVFRTSHVQTLNLLSPEDISSGELLIDPGNRLILCANNEEFTRQWGDEIRAFEIDELFVLFGGGFIVLLTGDMDDSGLDALRFGNASLSERAASFCEDQVVSFSSSGKSWTRNIVKTQYEVLTSGFTLTNPNPGR
ncbi:hypothetical protein ACFL6I_06140 [candidate division KSB1 bacterium]